MSNVKIWYYHQCAQHPEPTPQGIENHNKFRHYQHAIKEPDKQDFQAAMK
jgi:hypothetical protein